MRTHTSQILTALAVLLAIPALVGAQVLPCKTYGTVANERAYALVQPVSETPGYAIAGYTTGHTLPSDLLIVRTDTFGIPMWVKTNVPNEQYPGDDVVRSMVATQDGGYALCGWTEDWGSYLPPIHLQNEDMFVIKLDGNGNQQWGRTFGFQFDDRAYSITETFMDPGFIITGWTEWYGDRDIAVLKLDPLGNLQWGMMYDFSAFDNVDEGLSIVEVTGGSGPRYAVCGRANITSGMTFDGYVMLLDQSGVPVWSQVPIVAGVNEDEAWSVGFDGSDIVVAGWTDSYGPGGPGDASVFAWKVNLAGVQQWARAYGWTTNAEKLMDDRSLVIDVNGGYALAGWTRSAGPGAPPNPNFLMLKLNTFGNIVWSRVHPSQPGAQTEQAYPIINTMTSGYAAAGFTNSFGVGGDDFHFVTLDALGNRPVCVIDTTPPDVAFMEDLSPIRYWVEGFDTSHILVTDFSVQHTDVCTGPVDTIDVGCTKIEAPVGTIDSGVTVTPACSVYNYGNTIESYQVRMRVGGFYNRTTSVSGHTPGTWRYATFAAYSAWLPGTHAVTCSTELATDMQPGNDRCAGSVTVRRPGGHDVSCFAITAPVGTVDSGVSVVPACSVYNHGSATETYTVRMRIGASYSRAATVSGHPAGTARYVTFSPAWSAAPVGPVAVSCSTELGTDDTPGNNRSTGSVAVRRSGADVGCVSVEAPTGTISSGTTVVPACSVYNYGNTIAAYQVRMTIGTGYDTTASVAGHASGTWVRVAFPTWTANPAGVHAVRCYTRLTGDVVPANDTAVGTCTVRSRPNWPAGWHEVASMPTGPSGRPVKRGAWLAVDDDGMIYAAKGYKTGDFYSYDALTDNWTTLALIPSGGEGRLPEKGCKGVSDGSGHVYMTKGNNTFGFWLYDAGAGTWTALTDVPVGNSGKKVKGGTDLVYVVRDDTGWVYLLKGYRCDFLKYNTVSGAWVTLPDAPAGIKVKWDKGSWLSFDGENTIHAHKAKYYDRASYTHGLWRFDVRGDTWYSTQLAGMPLYGLHSGKIKKKKAKDGGCGAWYDGAIRALKGGNTQQFWKYTAAGDSWVEQDTIPNNGSTNKKKRVKHGGDIVHYGWGAFFALKGNKTRELWRYVVPATPFAPGAGKPAVAAEPATLPRTALRVGPNPVTGNCATVRYSVAGSGSGTLTVFDAAGRVVRRLSPARGGHGTVTADLSGLSAGVYLVRLDAAGSTAAAKLVIQRD